MPSASSIAVYVCTHCRNGPLRRVLASLDEAASRIQPGIEVAVVVVDDNPDGRARQVVDSVSPGFIRGLHYRHSGAQNISVARNLGIEAALELADWVAMTDDDQTVSPHWFEALVTVQRTTGADAVTGPVTLHYEEGAAAWLDDQPFAEFLEAPPHPDGSRVEVCSTGNSMLRSAFLRRHPAIRFRTDLGRVGGEDMVFYREAVAAGLDARYAVDATCFAEQPAERQTYRYILRVSYWMGNTEYLTNVESGEAGRVRLAVRGLRRLVEAVARPFRRLVRGDAPQWRYAGAAAARACGMLVGVAGTRVEHR